MSKCCYKAECRKHKKYGDYCHKHRNLYLLDSESNIIMKNFTNIKSDYYKKDLKLFYEKNINKECSLLKDELFEEIKGYIYTDKIIKIQSYYRGKKVRDKRIKCNNEEDFYTYEKLEDISNKYFYSYKDTKNIKWGFDIRSLKKLIDLGYDNPYTTEKIPNIIKEEVNKKIEKLKEDEYEDIDQIVYNDKKNMIKHRIIDLCSNIERSGFTCLVEWIENLNRRNIKGLYRVFEDTINYRAQLSMDVKKRIYPPNGTFFEEPMINVLNMSSDDILINILNEIDKFTKCSEDSDRKLGYMYFILSLSSVSYDCRETHIEWINFIN